MVSGLCDYWMMTWENQNTFAPTQLSCSLELGVREIDAIITWRIEAKTDVCSLHVLKTTPLRSPGHCLGLYSFSSLGRTTQLQTTVIFSVLGLFLNPSSSCCLQTRTLHVPTTAVFCVFNCVDFLSRSHFHKFVRFQAPITCHPQMCSPLCSPIPWLRFFCNIPYYFKMTQKFFFIASQ